VLLFADVERFQPRIVVELANRLRAPAPDGVPIVLTHSAQDAGVPASFASLLLSPVKLDPAPKCLTPWGAPHKATARKTLSVVKAVPAFLRKLGLDTSCKSLRGSSWK